MLKTGCRKCHFKQVIRIKSFILFRIYPKTENLNDFYQVGIKITKNNFIKLLYFRM